MSGKSDLVTHDVELLNDIIRVLGKINIDQRFMDEVIKLRERVVQEAPVLLIIGAFKCPTCGGGDFDSYDDDWAECRSCGWNDSVMWVKESYFESRYNLA